MKRSKAVQEVKEVEAGVYVIPGPVSLGLVKVGDGLLAVDTGLGEDSARKHLAAGLELDCPIRWIFNTHGHADHCGGNEFLVRKTGAAVLAPPGEAAFINRPWLEPAAFCGGAPFPEIRGRFLEARPSRVDIGAIPGILDLSRPGEGNENEAGSEPQVIPFPGHSPDMCGLLAGSTLFSADAFFPPGLIIKHGLLYHWHARRFLDSLERAGALAAERRLIPSHGPIDGFDCHKVMAANRAHVLEVEAAVLEELAEPVGREAVVSRMAKRFGVADNHASWALALGAVQGYLTGLREAGLATSAVAGGRLLWRRA